MEKPVSELDQFMASKRVSTSLLVGFIVMQILSCTPAPLPKAQNTTLSVGRSWPLTLNRADEDVLATWRGAAGIAILWVEHGRLAFWRSTAPVIYVETIGIPTTADLIYTADGLWHFIYTTVSGTFYQQIDQQRDIVSPINQIDIRGSDLHLHSWHNQIYAVAKRNGRYTMYQKQSDRWDSIWDIGVGNSIQISAGQEWSYLLLISDSQPTLFGRFHQEESWTRLVDKQLPLGPTAERTQFVATEQKITLTWITRETKQNRQTSYLHVAISDTKGKDWHKTTTAASFTNREQLSATAYPQIINDQLVVFFMTEKRGDQNSGQLGYKRLFWIHCSFELNCHPIQPFFAPGTERPLSQFFIMPSDQPAREQTFIVWGAYQSSYAQNRDWLITSVGGGS